jgi:uncharacterized membrane protein
MTVASSRRTSAAGAHEPPIALVWLARGLALAAVGLAAYILWVTASGDGQPAGCGNETGPDCGDVLASRWSHWLGLPVSLPALVVYALAFLALLAVGPGGSAMTRRDAWRALILLGALMGGAAAWFVALQVLVLDSFCPYCLAAHACAIVLAGFCFWYSPARWRRSLRRESFDASSIPARTAWALLLLGLTGPALLAGG